MKLKLAFSCILGLAASNALAVCYTVYDRTGHIVYLSSVPPVDMSRPLHDTMPKTYPGGHLVFDNAAQCDAQNSAVPVSPLTTAARAGRQPMLTDRDTAEAMGLPHTPITPNAVVVPQRPANLRPGVTLAESIPGAEPTAPASDAVRAQPGSAPAVPMPGVQRPAVQDGKKPSPAAR